MDFTDSLLDNGVHSSFQIWRSEQVRKNLGGVGRDWSLFSAPTLSSRFYFQFRWGGSQVIPMIHCYLRLINNISAVTVKLVFELFSPAIESLSSAVYNLSLYGKRFHSPKYATHRRRSIWLLPRATTDFIYSGISTHQFPRSLLRLIVTWRCRCCRIFFSYIFTAVVFAPSYSAILMDNGFKTVQNVLSTASVAWLGPTAHLHYC